MKRDRPYDEGSYLSRHREPEKDSRDRSKEADEYPTNLQSSAANFILSLNRIFE